MNAVTEGVVAVALVVICAAGFYTIGYQTAEHHYRCHQVGSVLRTDTHVYRVCK